MRDLEFGINAKDRTAPAFDSAESRAKRFNSQLDKTSSAYALAGAGAKAFAAAFTIAGIEQFGRIVRNVIGDAADLVDLADKVGVATDDLQRMQYGFKLAGIEAGEVDGLLTQWSKRIGEAYTQGGRLADILKANGIALTDGEGHLRSSVDLMRDYAELISRAGSDQERMTLALAGFGKAGDGMVLALRDGAAGFDKLMKAADDAGGVLDEEILRKAAEIDDAFDKIWRNFEINAKSAILTSAGAIDDIISKLRSGFQQEGLANAGALMGSLVGQPLKGGRLPSELERRFNAAFGEPEENDALVRMLRDRFAPKTIIPDDTSDRTASTKAATEQASAYDKVIQKLNEERDALGLSATEQKVFNELRRAGVTLASAEGRAIANLVSDIERQRAATEALAAQTEFLKSSTASFFTEMRQGFQAGEGVLASFGNAFGSLVDTMAVKVEERLAGNLIDLLMSSSSGVGFNPLNFLFPGAGGFTPNTTYGKFIGAYATGTESAPGGWSLVGEQGPELMNVPRGARILSADRTAKAIGGGPPVIIHMNVQTPDVEGFRRSENQIAARLNRVMARGARNN